MALLQLNYIVGKTRFLVQVQFIVCIRVNERLFPMYRIFAHETVLYHVNPVITKHAFYGVKF